LRYPYLLPIKPATKPHFCVCYNIFLSASHHLYLFKNLLDWTHCTRNILCAHRQ